MQHCEAAVQQQDDEDNWQLYLLNPAGISSGSSIQALLCLALIIALLGCVLPHLRPHTQQVSQDLW